MRCPMEPIPATTVIEMRESLDPTLTISREFIASWLTCLKSEVRQFTNMR